MRLLRDSSLLLLILWLTLALAGSALAEDFLLAEEDEDKIRPLLAELLPLAEKQLEEYGSDVARVYYQRTYDTQEESFEIYENIIWWIKRGEASDITNFVRDYLPGIEIKKVKAFSISPGRFDQQAVLAADIKELDSDRIHLQKGDRKNRRSNLVVAFDTAQPGDLLCLSIHREVDHALEWAPWLVAGDEPVSRAELRVKCDWRQAFSVFGYRFEKGKMNQEILEKDDHHILDLRIWADDIQPNFREPYSPSIYQQSPVLAVAWRGSRFSFLGKWLWWYQDHWNQVAASMSMVEEEFLREMEETEEFAGELTTETEQKLVADVFYGFVRDNLLEVPSRSYFNGDEFPTVDEILEARAGTISEKAFLFLAMLQSRDIEARLVWTHDPHRGGFLPEYPLWQQVRDPLVKVMFADGAASWYDPGCAACPTGQIRPRLRHTRALLYDKESAKPNKEFLKSASAVGTQRGRNPFLLYLNDVKRVVWNQIIFTPGDPKRISGLQKELLVLGPKNNEDSSGYLEFRSWGLTNLNKDVAVDGDFISAGDELAYQRFNAYEFAEARVTSSSSEDTLSVVLDLDKATVPQPMGNTWIIPAEVVFGEVSQEPWPKKRRTRFHISRTTKYEWECRVPLPEGWSELKPPRSQVLGIDLLQYRLKFRVADGYLVVNRELLELAGDIDDLGTLAKIGEEIEKIILLESSPLVLNLPTDKP